MANGVVRVAFVGSGGMAEAHSQALSKMEGVQIVGYCDPDRSVARERIKTYGGKYYADPAAMMDALRPDCVYFTQPPCAHGAELEAIHRNIPFFVEKPVGLDLALTKQIASAVRRAGLLTCVGYMNRYRPGVQLVKKALARDPAILLIGGWISGTPRPKRGKGIWTWWVDKKKSGGQFHEQVTHTVDLARYFCGEAKVVHAFAAKGFDVKTPSNYTIEDAVVASIRFQSGAVANLWAGCCANAGGGGVSLTVYAAKNTALFTGWEHSVRLLKEKKEPVEIAGAGPQETFAIEDAAFINAVRTGKAAGILSSYEDGAKTLAVTLAANESMKTGKPIRVRM